MCYTPYCVTVSIALWLGDFAEWLHVVLEAGATTLTKSYWFRGQGLFPSSLNNDYCGANSELL